MNEEDYRWAIELSSWLVRSDLNDQGIADAGDTEDRKRLAAALRGVAYSTSAANIRNWCITRALELDESLNLNRFRHHRFNKRELERRKASNSLNLLRVLLIPERAAGLDISLEINFDDEESVIYSIRNSVASLSTLKEPDIKISWSKDSWFDILRGKKTLSQILLEKKTDTKDEEEIKKFFACFDLQNLMT